MERDLATTEDCESGRLSQWLGVVRCVEMPTWMALPVRLETSLFVLCGAQLSGGLAWELFNREVRGGVHTSTI